MFDQRVDEHADLSGQAAMAWIERVNVDRAALEIRQHARERSGGQVGYRMKIRQHADPGVPEEHRADHIGFGNDHARLELDVADGTGGRAERPALAAIGMGDQPMSEQVGGRVDRRRARQIGGAGARP